MTQTPSNDEIVPNGTRVRLNTPAFNGTEGTVDGYHPNAVVFPYDIVVDKCPDYGGIGFDRHEFEVID